jgi:hypothetical protein
LGEGKVEQEKRFDFPIEREPVGKAVGDVWGELCTYLTGFGSHSPSQEPLGRGLESDDPANHYPVANPSLNFLFALRTLPERLEGRIRWQEEGKPPAEDGWSVIDNIVVKDKIGISRKETRDEKHEHDSKYFLSISDLDLIRPKAGRTYLYDKTVTGPLFVLSCVVRDCFDRPVGAMLT